MLDAKNFFGDFIKLEQGIFPDLKDELCCPICKYNYVHCGKVFPIDYVKDIKTSGVAIEFDCEIGHKFFVIVESHKGNSYMTYTDQNFREIKPFIPEKPQDEMTTELLKAFQSMSFVDKMEIMNAVLEKTKMKGNE